MYDFSILLPKEDDVSLEELAIDIEGFDTPDIVREVSFAAVQDRVFDDLRSAHGKLLNVVTHLKTKGCTEELVAIVGKQLVDQGVLIKVGQTDEAITSVESLIGKVSVDNIKKTLMKILDAIINLIQKFNDRNKKDTNTIKALLDGRLSDMGKVDTMKFSGIYGAVYPYKDYMKLVDELGKIDLLAEVSDKSPLSDGVSSKLKGLFKLAGYRVTESEISRDPDFNIPKDKMSNLGWEPGKMRDAAYACQVTLQYLRKIDKSVISRVKSQIKSATTADDSNKLKTLLSNLIRVISVVERISLVLSRQIIVLSGMLKNKPGAE